MIRKVCDNCGWFEDVSERTRKCSNCGELALVEHKPTPFQARIAANIKSRRESLGISVDDLGHKTGIGPKTLEKIENNLRPVSCFEISQIAKCLYCEPQHLMRKVAD